MRDDSAATPGLSNECIGFDFLIQCVKERRGNDVAWWNNYHILCVWWLADDGHSQTTPLTSPEFQSLHPTTLKNRRVRIISWSKSEIPPASNKSYHK